MNFKINRYLFSVSFYLFGCILTILPVFIFQIDYFKIIKNLFNNNFHLLIIIILIFFLIIILLTDYLVTKKDNLDILTKNINFINGGNNNNYINLILCIFVGVFEELLFRGYAYSLIIILKCNLFFIIVIVFVFSIIFSILHITQGKIGLIFSFVISILLFVTIFVTRSIWYAIVFHFLIDFIELSVIYPLQKRRSMINENNIY
jgi:membrane protease YdiL (CAAX protease family)